MSFEDSIGSHKNMQKLAFDEVYALSILIDRTAEGECWWVVWQTFQSVNILIFSGIFRFKILVNFFKFNQMFIC